jgi:YVTN family beta-propeller protein
MFEQTAIITYSFLAAGLALAALAARPRVAFTRRNLRGCALALLTVAFAASGAQAQTAAASAATSNSINLSGTSRVYVADYNGNRVRVFDPNSGANAGTPYVGSIPVGTNPFGMAASPDGRRLYVACSGSNNVYTIDTRTNQIAAPTVQVGAYPIHVAVAPKGDRIFVTSFYGNSVTVINVSNPTSHTIEKTLAVDWKPIAVAVKPGGRYLYVSQYENQQVKVFDIQNGYAEVDSFFTGEMGATQPIFITFAADGKRAFVANEGGGPNAGGTVSFVKTENAHDNEVTQTVALPYHHLPRGQMALSPNARHLYVPGAGEGKLLTIDTLTGTILDPQNHIYSAPHGVAMSPDGARLFVSIEGNLLSTVDTGLLATPGRSAVIHETFVAPEVPGGTRFLQVVYVNTPTCP